MSDESQSTASTSFGSVASETYDEMVADVAACATMESLVCGKGMPKATKQRARRRPDPMHTPTTAVPFSAYERVAAVVKACRAERKRAPLDPNAGDVEDERLFKMARFTDGMALDNYAPFLHYVPRLVNIVTLAEAIPVKGSGLTLPLDLFKIASRCNGAYFASKRFAAVQVLLHAPMLCRSVCSLPCCPRARSLPTRTHAAVCLYSVSFHTRTTHSPPHS